MDRNPLLGTWRLKSYVVTNDAGVRSTPYGEHPNGCLSYSADGRMYAMGTAQGRIAPSGVPTDGEQAALQKSMFAYAGTWSLEPGRVVHHVDLSWNQAWNGSDQVRVYELSGNTLVITATVTNPAGRPQHYEIAWEKVGATAPPTRAAK
jgi:hypothetical protein